MDLSLTIGGLSFAARAGAGTGFDATIPVCPLAPAALQPSAYGLPAAAAAPFSAGAFVASVDAGASINCPVVSSLCAHANGTHTECVGHILPGRVLLSHCGAPPGGLFPAVLVTVRPEALGASGDAYAPGAPDDRVVSFGALSRALDALSSALAAAGGARAAAAPAALLAAGGALCVRTAPNSPLKRSAHWEGARAPFFTPAALALARALGAAHVAVDVPSLDREDDGGALLAHREWWAQPPRGEPPPAAGSPAAAAAAQGAARLVTELAFFPDAADDGLYLLNLGVAAVDLDAAPSRLVLHALELRA